MKSLLKNLNKLELILNELEAQPINLKFDPFDPLSIESAIQEYNYGLDSIAGDEINNPIISSLLEGLKENARSEIIREAAEARLKNGEFLSYRWEESTGGPPRKYYQITDKGKNFLNELENTWTDLIASVNKITHLNQD